MKLEDFETRLKSLAETWEWPDEWQWPESLRGTPLPDDAQEVSRNRLPPGTVSGIVAASLSNYVKETRRTKDRYPNKELFYQREPFDLPEIEYTDNSPLDPRLAAWLEANGHEDWRDKPLPVKTGPAFDPQRSLMRSTMEAVLEVWRREVDASAELYVPHSKNYEVFNGKQKVYEDEDMPNKFSKPTLLAFQICTMIEPRLKPRNFHWPFKNLTEKK